MNDSDLEDVISLDEFFSRTSLPLIGSDHAYRRLEILYEISRVLTAFDSIDKTIPEVLALVEQTFPIRSAVLVENRRMSTRTIIWLASNLNNEQIKSTISRARRTFSYMTYATIADSAVLQLSSFASVNLGHILLPNQLLFDEQQNLFAVPLVVDRAHIFGILQFDGIRPSNEEDLQFASALTNLFAVAFDRSYRAEEERSRILASAETALIERDESVRVASELAEERSLRERFVQMLSHDLRTPLSAISMTAQILKRSKSTVAEEFKLVDRLISNAKRLDFMIEALLDANRLKAGEPLPLEIDKCDFSEIAEAVVIEQRETSERNIEYDGPDRTIGYWDRGGLRRLTENLIGNAVKYSTKKSTIKVSLNKISKGVSLEIHNEGVPISHDEQKTLFDQFRRTKSAATGGRPGWGLGLTLVRGLCEAHGGTISVKSEIDEGTCFIARFPYDSRPFPGGKIEISCH